MKHWKLLALTAAVVTLLLIWLRHDAPHGGVTKAVRPEAAVNSSPDTRLAETIALEKWAATFSAAANSDRSALEAEGVALARTRLAALANLIMSDPEQALANELPFAARRALPPAVQALLEERISARTDFDVMGLVPLPGRETATTPPSSTRAPARTATRCISAAPSPTPARAFTSRPSRAAMFRQTTWMWS